MLMPPGSRSFLELAGTGATLDSFSINTFGDCCTSDPGTAVIGGVGRLNGGTVHSDSFVSLGAGSEIIGCTFHLSGHSKHRAMLFSVDGNVTVTTILSGQVLDLQVSGELDIDDSRGGRLIHRRLVEPAKGESNGSFTFDGKVGGGLLQASFAGVALTVQCAAFGDELACAAMGPPMRSGLLALGKLESSCHRAAIGEAGQCTLTGSLEGRALLNESRVFEVRRLVGISLPLPHARPPHATDAAEMIAARQY